MQINSISMLSIITPSSFNYTLPPVIEKEIIRETFLETIERLLIVENNDVVFIEGLPGSGKTTLCTQFLNKKIEHTISYFISNIDRYSHSRECLNENLFQQLHNYLYPETNNNNLVIPDNFIIQMRSDLDRKIRKLKKGTCVFFIFDGCYSLSKQSIHIFKELISDLPWGKVKFIFTGDADLLRELMPSEKIKYKPFPINYFTLPETKEYLSEFDLSEIEFNEIYDVSMRGLPEKLSQIRRIGLDKGIEKLLIDLENEKTTLMDIEWRKVLTETQKNIISILCFSEPTYNLLDLARIVEVDIDLVRRELNLLPFLAIKGNIISFINEDFIKYSKVKLSHLEQSTLAILIKFHLKNQDKSNPDTALFSLYMQAKKWKEIIKHLSFDTFIQLIEKHNSFSTINDQLDIGLKASKSSENSYSDFMKFGLPKSSFQEIEKLENLESEIQARIALGDVDGAMSLLDKIFLKEDRLKLLAIIAKQKKENNLSVEDHLITQISELYKSIDPESLKDRAIQLASILLYSCPELAIDLIEKTTDNSSGTQSLDKAFAVLSLTALKVNKTTKSNTADLSALHSKISNSEEKDFILALSHLVEEYSSASIIDKAKSLTTTSKKLFLLKNWILFNVKSVDVDNVIKAGIEEIIKSSNDEAPNASILMEFAKPLPFIDDLQTIEDLITLFDTQKDIITTPTRDYIKLQLTIVEAEIKVSLQKGINRLLEIYYKICAIEDRSIRNDSMVLLWLKLKNIDSDGAIEKQEGLRSLAKQDIDSLLKDLLESTALHFQVVEYIITYAVEFDSQFILELIEKLNVEMRRDMAYVLAIQKYVENKKPEIEDFDFLKKCLDGIKNKDLVDEVVVDIVNYFIQIKNPSEKLVETFLAILPYTKAISDSGSRCFVICKMINFLNTEGINKDSLILDLLPVLEISWKSIDALWTKIDIGFGIAKELSLYSKEIAQNYFANCIIEKDENIFESHSIALAYIASINLCLRAFGGMIKAGGNYDDDLSVLGELIDIIPCNGERIKLFSKLAIKFYLKNNESVFKSIFKKHISKSLLELKTGKDQGYYYYVLKSICPTLYLYHKPTFESYIIDVPDGIREVVLNNVCEFLLKRSYTDDTQDSSIDQWPLEYETAIDIIELIENMNDDNSIYNWIKDIVLSIKKPRDISANQKSLIVEQLKRIIKTKLPNIKSGIKHDGYKLISEIYIESLRGKLDKDTIDSWRCQALKILNISDRTMILHTIASELEFKSSQQKNDILKEAFTEAKAIPAIFDKMVRYEQMLPTLAETNKPEFTRTLKQLISDLVTDSDEEQTYTKHRKLVDLLHQNDPDNVGTYINMLDKDEVRNKKLTKSIKERIEMLDRKKVFTSDISKAKKIKRSSELSSFSGNLLSKLESGQFTPKEPIETFDLLEAASTFSLSEAYNTYSFCIENIVKKYERSSKSYDHLRGIFDATIFNVRLISTLSQTSIQKMRNRHSIIVQKQNLNKTIYKAGERELAIKYIIEWLEVDPKDSKITLIDPYFRLQDLDFLKIIKEIRPDADVFILTSKGGLTIESNFEEHYTKQWEKISIETPPNTTIKIIWTENDNQIPFHDRYLLSNERGLKLGSSIGTLAESKDSSISPMGQAEVLELDDTLVKDYILKTKTYHNDRRIKHSTFNI